MKRDSENAPLILAYDGKMIETDETFLDAIQAFIDRDGMAKMNGNYEFTYGVPPECQGYRITAVYESGEALGAHSLVIGIEQAADRLIYHINPVCVNIIETYYVLFGAFAYCYYPVSFAAGISPLEIVGEPVCGVVHIRKGLECHIMYGYH